MCDNGGYEDKFRKALGAKRSAEARKELSTKKRTLQKSENRIKEQEELREKITMLEEEIQDQVENVDRFIQMVKKYLYLEKLTPAVLNDMVNAVYVHAPDKSSGHRIQDVDISYNYIGMLSANLLYDIQNGETA